LRGSLTGINATEFIPTGDGPPHIKIALSDHARRYRELKGREITWALPA
jgi:hypothetical protein